MPAKFTKKITTTYSMTSVAELTRAEILGLLLSDLSVIFVGSKVFQDRVDVDLLNMALLEDNWIIETHLDDARGHWTQIHIGNQVEGSQLKGYYTISICPVCENGLDIVYQTCGKNKELLEYRSHWNIKECMKFLTNELV